MDPQAYGQADTLMLGQSAIQGGHDLDNPQPGPDRTLGIVFMRLRIAEVDQQPIAQILGDVAVEALDDLSTDALVGTDDLTEIFWVELRRERCRVDQVTKQHGELPAFGLRRRYGRGRHLSRVVFLPYGLLRRLWGGRNSCRMRFSGPHQHSAIVVDRKVVDLKQLFLEGFERFLIEMKLEREGAVGHAPATLEHGDRLVEDLFKGHGPPSLGRCGVLKTVWEWVRSFGCIYMADGGPKQA
jgi:hypothetical protein